MSHSQPTAPALIDCETAARALYDYLDGRLPEATETAVSAHVETCKACSSHFEFARRVLTLMPSALPLGGESSLLRARIVSTLAADGYSGQ
jgi:anti-sigma factor RsiW